MFLVIFGCSTLLNTVSEAFAFLELLIFIVFIRFQIEKFIFVYCI